MSVLQLEMLQGYLDATFSDKQKNFLNSADAKINLTEGSVRSGKTFITNIMFIMYAYQGPKGKLLMSGRTKSTVKDNLLTGEFGIFDIVERLGFTYEHSEMKGELTLFSGTPMERFIKIVGADNIEAEAKIRGQTYAGWYGDEITIQHPKFVKQAILRCSVPNSQIFWTTNPDHPKHYIKTDFMENEKMRENGQFKSWKFLLTDNETLTDDYMDLIKASFSGVMYARNIDGEWVIAEGVVYGQDYKPEVHRVRHEVIEEMLKAGEFKRFIGGVDWGYSHPMVGLYIGITKDDKYYVISEFYKKEQRTEDLAQWFLKEQEYIYKLTDKKIFQIYCDSAEPDRIVTLVEHGLPATTSDKRIKEGINSVQTTFKNNRLFISEYCMELDAEFGLYRYPDEDDPKFRTGLPLDEDNHAMDAIRYPIHNYELYLAGNHIQEDMPERRKTAKERRREIQRERKERRRKKREE